MSSFAPVRQEADRVTAWSHAYGAFGNWDSDGNAASFERSVGGVFFGADVQTEGGWRLGVLGGYSSSSFDLDNRSSSGDVNGYHLGVYAGAQQGALGFRLGASYTWHSVETERMINVLGMDDTLEADYDAATGQMFAEVGYRLKKGKWNLEVFSSLSYVRVTSDAFTESGGIAALSADASSEDLVYSTLGLRAESDVFLLNSLSSKFYGMIGWQHAFGEDSPTTNLQFAGGDSFGIAGVPIARDSVLIGFGLGMLLSDHSRFDISYNGQLGTDAVNHNVSAAYTFKF